MPGKRKLSKDEIRRHYENAFRNYGAMVNWEASRQNSQAADKETRPEDPQDPLELLGDLSTLELTPGEVEQVRSLVAEEIERRGEDYVWDHRVLLKDQLWILLRF